MPIRLSYPSDLDPKLRRIFDELSTKSINGRVTPLFEDEVNLHIGIRTITPQYPFEVNGDARIRNGRLIFDSGFCLGCLSSRNIDVPGQLSSNLLTVHGQSYMASVDIFGILRLSNALAVGSGGTGAVSLTANSLILGNGATALSALGAATNGQLPIGSTSAAPVLAALTGTANRVTVSNGAGTITLSGPQDLATTSAVTFGRVALGDSAGAAPTANTLWRDNLIKGWISFDQTGITQTYDSFNVSSLTDNAVGDFTISWDTDMANANYALIGSTGRSAANDTVLTTYQKATQTVGASRAITHTGGTLVDSDYVSVFLIGDQ